MFNNMLMGAAGESTKSGAGYSVTNSAVFNGSNEYLSRTLQSGTATGGAKKFTVSWWWKDCTPDYTDNANYTHFGNGGTNFFEAGVGAGSTAARYELNVYSKDSSGSLKTDYSNNIFRDPHGWHHFVVAIDTNASVSAANRKLMYHNGVVITKRSAENFADDVTFALMTATNSQNWAYNGSSGNYMPGYLAQCALVDGLQLEPTAFGEFDTNGVWRPIDLSSSSAITDFGTYGYWLEFKETGTGQNSSGLGADTSGKDNHFAINNMGSTNQTTDSPTNNSAVLSELWTDATLSEGNLKVAATGNSYQWAISTFAIPSSGKWTFEAQSSNIDGSSKYGYVGICQMGNHNARTGNNYMYGINAGTGEVVKNSSAIVDIGSPAGTSLWRIEYDADADTIKIFDDGTEVFPASTGESSSVALSGQNSLHFFVAPYGSAADFTVTFTGLSGTPTTDYKELTTDNFYENSEPAIEDGEKHFVPVLWQGNETERDITTVIPSGDSIQFDPDLVWGKDTDNGSYTWRMFDILRGSADSYEVLESNSTAAETADSNGVRQFTPNGSGTGFEIGTGAALNESAGPDEIIAYIWKGAGSGTTKTVGSVSSGVPSVASVVTANTTSGFSAGTFTPPSSGSCTVAHGLGGTPDWIIVKPRDETESWVVWHSGFCSTSGNNNRIFLEADSTNGTGDKSIPTVTSTTFTCPDDSYYHSRPFIFYAWRSIAGFSKFGTYEGNNESNPSQNNIDGAITFLDFKPALVILKNIDQAEDWFSFDNKREGWNAANNYIKLNTTGAENTSSNALDFGTNYFKMRYNDGAWNHAQTYIYCAWAEHPLAGTSPALGR